MIKTNLFTSLALMGAAIFSMSCRNTPKLKALPDEDVINLSSDVVTPTVQATYTSNATCLTLNGACLNTQTVTLPVTDVDALYTQAKKLLGSGGPGYITAVFVYFGVNSATMQMTYYFLPVCLQTTPAPSGAGTYTYYPTPASAPSATNPFYTVNSAGTFTVDATNQIQKDTTSYKTYIAIVHYSGDTYPHYMNFPTYPNNLEDDIYIVYPFQEIRQYMTDNSISSTGSIVLYNTCIQVTSDGTSYMRHDLSIGNPTTGGSGAFSQNYADLGHLTPPEEENLTYTITGVGCPNDTSSARK